MPIVKCNNQLCKHMDRQNSDNINDWVCKNSIVDFDWKHGAQNWEPDELTCLSFEDKEDSPIFTRTPQGGWAGEI